MRCFIALPLPEEARRALARSADACRAALSSSSDANGASGVKPRHRISWTRPEGYHLTLAFLGEIEGAAIEAAKAALDAVSGFGVIGFSFAGIGGFPLGRSARNARSAQSAASSAPLWRVLFAEIDDEGGCAALHRAVNEALAEKALRAGLPVLNPEWPKGATGGRAFAPHITLARAGTGSGIAAAPARRAAAGLSGAWTIGRCALYKSELRSSGSVYTEIRGVDL
jgi:2'-5' RNA ligase